MPLSFIPQAFEYMPTLQPVFATATGEGDSPVAAFGLPERARMALALQLQKKAKQPIFLLIATEAEARQMAEEATLLGGKAVVFPARDYAFLPTLGHSKEYEHQRIHALWQLVTGEADVLLLDAEAFTQKTISLSVLKERAVTLSVGEEYSISALREKLVTMGYDITEQVDGMGQFSVRGGIVDVFSAGMEQPVRIEFWGDEIDTISSFDPMHQRRGNSREQATLLPAVEAVCKERDLLSLLEQKAAKINQKNTVFHQTLLKDIDTLKSGGTVSTDRYMEELGTLSFFADILSQGILMVSESRNILARFQRLEEARALLWEDWLKAGVLDTDVTPFCDGKTALCGVVKRLRTIYMDSFTAHSYPVPPKAVTTAFLKQLTPWGGSLDVLLEDIRPAIARGQKVVILAGGEKGAAVLCNQLENNSITARYDSGGNFSPSVGVSILPAAFSSGFEWPEQNLLVIAHKPLGGLLKKKKRRLAKGQAFRSLDELKVGDYVVHAAHGIGQFDGIHRMETGRVVKDYIKIKYRGTDVLYLPVTQLDLVSRYIGAGGESGPPLHRLGGTEWQKTRTRVKAAVRDMAKELARLYGERMKIKGYAFSPDHDLQADFEARFPFEETDDQLRAIDEIKGDMQREVPMDRLLCGDVGFGKTEVALRAAFKCICDGKQCAILVPTTILAWQHFLTATERFGELPVRVEMLSRFCTKKQIEKTLVDLRHGEIDLIIGTHRIISNDVRFRDLGLVIIDEEQRFGVAQKEKLKTAFQTVDVLTLSATPIPRTLNMALSGIRDMSSIEEAPQDRRPVQTYVLEQNNPLLVEAMQKELRRGGQVYYLHNRVESIYHTAARLSAAMPEARIGVAHGKMKEEELSLVWKDLLEGEIDVLVCTTIIETGVDVPNVNTLIIEDADRMGLAQLHQIRGRVGRSSRRAYAYFCFRRGKALSEIATKRMEAIREYTEFGSGFKIAMRDLEIRGAGNILGGEQHGHMEAVGYDMYMELLQEAISEQTGKETVKKVECLVDLDISANIPEAYIPSLSHRLSIYRRIADIQTKEDRMDVIDELCDRFGEPPESVLGLMDIALLRGAAAKRGVYEISGDKTAIRFYLKEFRPDAAGEWMKLLGNEAKLIPREPVHFLLPLKVGENISSKLRHLAEKWE